MVLGILIMLSKQLGLATTTIETWTFMGREVATSNSGVLFTKLGQGGGRLLANA